MKMPYRTAFVRGPVRLFCDDEPPFTLVVIVGFFDLEPGVRMELVELT